MNFAIWIQIFPAKLIQLESPRESENKKRIKLNFSLFWNLLSTKTANISWNKTIFNVIHAEHPKVPAPCPQYR